MRKLGIPPLPLLLLLAGLVLGCLDRSTDPPGDPGGNGSGDPPDKRDTGVGVYPDIVPSRPLDSAAPVVLERLFEASQAPLQKPVWFGPLPGRRGEFIALEQHGGTVVLLRRDSAGAWTREDFLRLEVQQERECGLLGIAFHPDFPRNRKYYLNYNPRSGPPATVIEERKADASLRRDAGEPGRVLLRVPQEGIIHRGGHIAFGPKDGFLYIGMGDGGDVAPAQDLGSLLGKMLRIDVDRNDPGLPYAVPPDNPFVGRGDARGEIWAYGLRNPWRWSFDPATGHLWAGDVGETAREEVTRVPRGANLGWPHREGRACRTGVDDCIPPEGAVEPVLELGRGESTVLIGGLVYRGDPASPYYGAFFFADYRSRDLWALRLADGAAAGYRKVGRAPGGISSFGADAEGNLYAVDHEGGAVYRLGGADLPLK